MAGGELILPEENAPIHWMWHSLRLDFYPPIKLTRRDGLRFGESIAEYIEPEDVQPGVTEWQFSGGAICEGMNLHITRQSIRIDVRNPSNSLEWYEHRFEPILKLFSQTFSPQVALQCNVAITGLVDLPPNMDARSFLGGYVMQMHPYKLEPIERPLHVLGVRLFFPPFAREDGSRTDWSVNVRVESGINDPGKLFLESTAEWREPAPWNTQYVTDAVGRLGLVSSFMSDKLVKFLRQPPFPESEDDPHVE
jgi:hypothetical protein